MFAGLECAAEKARGRHDVGNELIAGCATGAALAAGQGIQVSSSKQLVRSVVHDCG